MSHRCEEQGSLDHSERSTGFLPGSLDLIGVAKQRGAAAFPRQPDDAFAGWFGHRDNQPLSVPDGSTRPSMLVTPKTVRAHVRHILDRLRARNRPHAVAIAFSAGLIWIDEYAVPDTPAGGLKRW